MPMGPSDHIPRASGPRKERKLVRDSSSARSTGALSPCMMQTKPLNPHILLCKLAVRRSKGGHSRRQSNLPDSRLTLPSKRGRTTEVSNWLELQVYCPGHSAATPFQKPHPPGCEQGRI